ncbi:MAG: recombinase family protein [Ruthenibacterium lactatiformans]
MSYMNGDTMQSIANQLQLKGIPYSETSGIWSKHMVRRIL